MRHFGLRFGTGRSAAWLLVAAWGCTDLQLDPPAEVIHARFDPDAEVIPMPTDILRDAGRHRLDVPTDGDDLTAAEREFYQFLDTMDGWSTTMAATVELTAPISPATLTPDTLQVWHWRETATRVEDVTITLDPTETEITIDPPRTGWERGGNYFVVLRGGAAGVEGKRGEPVECDAAFYFLRLDERLDTPEHERAFPGNSRAERRTNAVKLELIRRQLVPYFDFLEDRGLPRDQVAALWSFTITERTELAMDKASQRMPLPIDLLIDPDRHRVDLPPAAWDSEVEVDAKQRLAEYDGFGTSSNLMFGFTGPIDPATVTEDSVRLYRASNPPRRVPAKITVLPDHTNVEIEPETLPLAEQARYAVVLDRSIRDADGKPIALMPLGHFIGSHAPLVAGGASTVDAVAYDDARRVEVVRNEVTGFLEELDAEEVDPADILSAWTFTTMSVTDPIEDWMHQPERIGVSPDPEHIVHMTPIEALGDFVLAISSLLYVGDVYHGTIESPEFLDPLTRGWRSDGGHEVQDIPFTMAVPKNLDPDTPVPVVIFGHAIMTERRFVLAIADALAARGYAAISIDFPFHGKRTYCWHEGPLTVPNPTTGELTEIDDPCQDGTTCAPDGRCVDAANQGNALRNWPVLGMPEASGAAFIEIEKIGNTRDHFRQALIDLESLRRSLLEGDWKSVIGAPIDTDRIYYIGQSLGGIIGASYVALTPELERAVLNVPGADTVDLFDDSPFFGGQVDAFFTREGVDRDSFEGHRFLNVAHWLMDSTDPQSFADRVTDGHDVLIQMALMDFIIPNDYTIKLADLAGISHRDYAAEHAFLVIPVEPEYLRGVNEAAAFIDGGELP